METYKSECARERELERVKEVRVEKYAREGKTSRWNVGKFVRERNCVGSSFSPQIFYKFLLSKNRNELFIKKLQF